LPAREGKSKKAKDKSEAEANFIKENFSVEE
jgi:hypothetical protein